MRRHMSAVVGLAVVLAALAVGARPVAAFENRVTVESRTFYPGQTACTVGVFFENSVTLGSMYVPFEFRSITVGAYPASYFFNNVNPKSRLSRSTMGVWPEDMPGTGPNYSWRGFKNPDTVNSCSGPSSHTWRTTDLPFNVLLSPDAIRFATGAGGIIYDTIVWTPEYGPGRDVATTDSASLWFRFAVSMTEGQFEIDTCCTYPGGHLVFGDTNSQAIYPSFTKGVITIACQCPCASDPNCDGVKTDILDVFETINVAFRGTPAVQDPGCARSRTDVNCDGVTDVVDAVVVGMVSFGGLDPAVYYCAPCE